MQYTTLLLATVASLAAAQTVTVTANAPQSTSASSCDAQNILDACISTIQGQINACANTDYSCLCTQYVNLLTCYANCPADPGVGTARQQRQQFCEAASVYGSTTTYGLASSTSRSGSQTTATDDSSSAVQTGFSQETGTSAGGIGSDATSTASASSSTNSDNAASNLQVAGGLVAIVAAGLGLVL